MTNREHLLLTPARVLGQFLWPLLLYYFHFSIIKIITSFVARLFPRKFFMFGTNGSGIVSQKVKCHFEFIYLVQAALIPRSVNLISDRIFFYQIIWVVSRQQAFFRFRNIFLKCSF